MSVSFKLGEKTARMAKKKVSLQTPIHSKPGRKPVPLYLIEKSLKHLKLVSKKNTTR